MSRLTDAAARLHSREQDQPDTDPAGEASGPQRHDPRRAVVELATAQLAELRHLTATMTEFVAAQRSQIVNGVLSVDLIALDAQGLWERGFQVPVGHVVVDNLSATDLTVTSAPAQSSAPPSGRGVQVVPAYCSKSVPIGSHTFTVYGTPGAKANVQAFATPVVSIARSIR